VHCAPTDTISLVSEPTNTVSMPQPSTATICGLSSLRIRGVSCLKHTPVEQFKVLVAVFALLTQTSWYFKTGPPPVLTVSNRLVFRNRVPFSISFVSQDGDV
jgi:hypothetical protein